MLTRRAWMISAACASAGSLLLSSRSMEAMAATALPQEFERLERQSGGRLGVAMLDLETGARAGYRQQERFPLCSTFKLLLAGAVLVRVDEGREQLTRRIHFDQKDLLSYAPVTSTHLPDGMTVQALCAAAMMESDNTAANLLLASLGGPIAVTTLARRLGDSVTRLDRNEPSLNEALPGDERDTTCPEAMIANLHALVVGNALSTASRHLLVDWLLQCKTGGDRLRAGFPVAWRVGDKTGTGERGTANDVAIAWPPRRRPVLVAAYLTGSTGNSESRNRILSQVSQMVTAAMQG